MKEATRLEFISEVSQEIRTLLSEPVRRLPGSRLASLKIKRIRQRRLTRLMAELRDWQTK